MALTHKQKLFVNEYLIDFNASAAARRAGYPKKTAPRIGWQNINKPEVADAIRRRIDEACMTADEVLLRLAEQARSEYSAYITDEGKVDLVGLKKDGKTHLIKSIKDTAHGKSIEFYDGQTALIQIGKYHKLFIDRQEVTGADGGPIAMKGYTTVSPDDWHDDAD